MKNLIALVVSAVVLFAAFPAFASDPSVDVTVDQARLNRELGSCGFGRRVAVTIEHHTVWSPPGVTGYSVAIPQHTLVGGFPLIDVNVFCGDHRETNLADAVEIAIHN